MAILKFYAKLVNDNLPNYFESFTPQFSAGHQHYNFRNPSRLLPKIKHEFSRQSLRYKLISTLNETSNVLLEMAKTLSQKNFMNFVRNEILTSYLSCMQTNLDLSYLPCVNSDLCAISFALLFICAGMHTTHRKQCCVLISYILTINAKFMNNTFVHINHPIISS